MFVFGPAVKRGRRGRCEVSKMFRNWNPGRRKKVGSLDFVVKNGRKGITYEIKTKRNRKIPKLIHKANENPPRLKLFHLQFGNCSLYKIAWCSDPSVVNQWSLTNRTLFELQWYTVNWRLNDLADIHLIDIIMWPSLCSPWRERLRNRSMPLVFVPRIRWEREWTQKWVQKCTRVTSARARDPEIKASISVTFHSTV